MQNKGGGFIRKESLQNNTIYGIIGNGKKVYQRKEEFEIENKKNGHIVIDIGD